MTTTHRWSRLLAELREQGPWRSDQALATELRVAQSTVHRLRTGAVAQPMHDLGRRIEALHTVYCTSAPDPQQPTQESQHGNRVRV